MSQGRTAGGLSPCGAGLLVVSGGASSGAPVFSSLQGPSQARLLSWGGIPRTRGCFLLPENLPSPRSSPTPGARGPRVSVTWGLWPVTGPGAHRGRSPEPGQRSRCPPGRAVAPWLWLPMVPHGLWVGWGGRSPRLLRVRGRPQRLGGREVPVPPSPRSGPGPSKPPAGRGQFSRLLCPLLGAGTTRPTPDAFPGPACAEDPEDPSRQAGQGHRPAAPPGPEWTLWRVWPLQPGRSALC